VCLKRGVDAFFINVGQSKMSMWPCSHYTVVDKGCLMNGNRYKPVVVKIFVKRFTVLDGVQ